MEDDIPEPEGYDEEVLVSHNVHLLKLLDDSDKRYEEVSDTLGGVRMRNRQLSISLTKEKEERLRTKMALNIASEKADENRLSLNRNLEKVSQLENEVDELTQEKDELSELLESAREKSTLLQSELDIVQSAETLSARPGISTKAEDSATEGDTENDLLQGVVFKLKKKLDTKDMECNELEDKLSVMRQEFVRQGEQLARASSEFEQQLSRLHDVLSKERQLNSLLSEESDQTMRELQTKLQEQDELNTELQSIHERASERIMSIEEQSLFYRTKLKETEQRLNVICNEYEQSTNSKERKSVSCQVREGWGGSGEGCGGSGEGCDGSGEGWDGSGEGCGGSGEGWDGSGEGCGGSGEGCDGSGEGCGGSGEGCGGSGEGCDGSGEGCGGSGENEKLYWMLIELSKGDVCTEFVGNSRRHKLNIIRLIQNGFKNLSGDTEM